MNLSDPSNLLIAGIYLVFVVLLTFFSLFGVYILVRYGKSPIVSVTISIIYALFFLTILSQSYTHLSALLI